MAEIPQTAWDALAQPLKTPFLEWEWLNTLETSGSAHPTAGWQPHHLTVWRNRNLIAAAPLYLKGHSYGEFVFDQQWAEVAQRLGIAYYPKLLGMTPFTPAEGYRFLIAPDEDEDALTELMVKAIDTFCLTYKISSCHFLYVDPVWQPRIEQQGFSPWMHHSYIWSNHNYQTFEDYLGDFNSNQRRNIKRERKAVSNAGLALRTVTGEDIPQPWFGLMYDFYADTCDKFGWWGSKYLTRQFFEQLHTTFRQRVVFCVAHPPDNPNAPLGMSFCITKGENLYGRYWGSFQEFDCLHFNACYYSPIEWGIANGIQRFDPGAGGRHKQRRGFPATPNYSVHRFYHPRLAAIWEANIDNINRMEGEEIEALNAELPLKSYSTPSATTNVIA